jgi:hypothetical protein
MVQMRCSCDGMKPVSILASRAPGLAAAALALCLPLAAQADPNHPALRNLLPLLEVFGPGQKIPSYDVAGLRCAGLRLAQADWATRSPDFAGPTAAEMAEADLMLEASEQQRLNDGMDLARAHVSIERDARRIWRLYDRRFAGNVRKGGHPWANDPLVTGDMGFCERLARRG